MMYILWDERERVFHLRNNHFSYVLGILKNGHLGHFYYGKPLSGALSSTMFRRDQNRGLTNYVYEGDMSFSLNLERLEYPCFGTTDYRVPAIELTGFNGSSVLDFVYCTHRIDSEKGKIPGLPTSQGDELVYLEIDLVDERLNLVLTLCYTIYNNSPVMTRSSRLQNLSDQSVDIRRLLSVAIDLPDDQWEWVQLNGDWTREREVNVRPLHVGIQSVGSLRGASSAAYNPFVALKRPSATEESGEVVGFSLMYSGNFLIEAEVNNDHMTRMVAGIHPNGFKWQLEPLSVFYAPEAVLCYSSAGIGGMSRGFHDFVRTHIQRKKEISPVLLNNWEATYFDFDSEKIYELAKSAKELGVELLVLDDGWFGTRNDDTSGLGDWTVNESKLVGGLKALSDRIHALGMKFGLWIEPEMINTHSNLFKKHPDWRIGDPSRRYSHGRNQYVLDFSREEVVDEIYHQLVKIFDDAPVDYVKWDMNRNITEPYSIALGANRQGELFHRYILGVYRLYEMLKSRYPNILFESCSAGGARFDLGMLYYSQQVWTSDNTDAMERLKIQYGTSLVYPLSSMGSHVSDVPNHQVKRLTSLKTRADVAYFGTFGYELNVMKLNENDRALVSDQIEMYKSLRSLVHQGDFYRLISPFNGDLNRTAWMVLSKAKDDGLIAWYQVLARPNQGMSYLKLQGLEESVLYALEGHETPYSGAYLMQFGIPIPPSFNGIEYSGDSTGDFQSRTWRIRKIDFN